MTISRRQFGLGAAAAVLAVPLIDRMDNRSADAAEPAAAATVTTYPTPSYFNESSSYSLKVESDEIDVVKNFGYSWARFSYSGTAEFTVTAKEDIDSYDISPHSYGVKATTNGRDLTFSLSQEESRYLVIKINGLENLAITADPLETGRPSPNGREVKSINDYSGVDNTDGKLMTSVIQDAIDDANARDGGGTVYFPNGVYKFSQIELKSDVTLYLAAGAVLRGSEKLSDYDWTGDHFRAANIRIDGASDVAITGRGIIDSNGSALTSGDSGPNRENIVSSYKGSNGSRPKGLTFEGITLRDGTTWNFNLQSSTDVKIHNVKIFNNDTWIHGDGFDLVTTSHAVVDQCFAYTGDDAFCAKGSADDTMTDVVFQNSVAYTRSAGAKVGMQGASDISDIWFKNIDVIQGYRGVSVDHDQGSGSWTDLHFIDIRTQKIYDNGTQGQFRTAPILIWTEEKDGVGPVSKVELTRCSFEDIEDFHSIIQGHDESSRVTDVTITDLTVNGELIEKASDALIDIKEHTSDITFATS